MPSQLVITIGGLQIEIAQSILVWLILCVAAAIFFIIAGSQIAKADPSKPSRGIVWFSEEMVGLYLYVTGSNLGEKALNYISLFGTLLYMMLLSNLVGLLGVQNPTSNVSFNLTLALMFFFMIQFYAIRKNGLKARLKELTEPFWLLTPLNIIGELALPLSMTMRLFGNILSGGLILLLIYTAIQAAGPLGYLGLVLTPFLHAYFDIFSGLIQTYIFFTLGTYFLGEQLKADED